MMVLGADAPTPIEQLSLHPELCRPYFAKVALDGNGITLAEHESLCTALEECTKGL